MFEEHSVGLETSPGALNVHFVGGLRRHTVPYMTVLDRKKLSSYILTHFVLKSLVLDPDPDWIRFQQEPGSAKYLDPGPKQCLEIVKCRILDSIKLVMHLQPR
jgi:hypothetical protein